MQILLVTHYYSTHRGGVEAVAHRLAIALLQDQDLAVQWIASDSDPVPPSLPGRLQCLPAASWNGIERVLGLPFPLWSLRSLCRLRRAVNECDVLHLHDTLYMGNLCAFLFARMARKPVVITQHIGAIPYDSRLLRALLELLNRTLVRAVLARAERVFFVSPAVQRYFQAFCSFRSPPVYAPNGVDGELYAFAGAAQAVATRQAAGRDARRPLCLFVGRFVERKGVALVLELAGALPEIDWIVAGDGPMRPEDARLPNVTVMRGLEGREIARLYRMSDLLVLPSKGEGFPLVVQEAMACGTPALVSPETAAGCPAVREFLFTEDVLSKDAAQRWRSRIDTLMRRLDDLGDMRARVAAAARAQWSWEVSGKNLAAALGEVAAGTVSS
ncbi:MAG: glycosyltransferase family 1 protein [Betaproteobacteria bacterium]|nr:MAG: glycosyltransferase family 1 protein [Betaproteobacteria bacterium]